MNVLLALATALAFLVFFVFLLSYFYRKKLEAYFLGGNLEFPNQFSRFIKVDGVNLHFTTIGNGPDILLLHGIGANIFCWRFLIPLLAKNFRVWALDQKGFGQSDKPPKGDYGLKAQAQLNLQFLKANDIKQCTVVGNSMGGAIGAEMSLQAPNLVKNLVLLNSAHDPKIIRRFFPIPLHKARHILVAPMAPLVNRFTVKNFLKTLYGTPQEISQNVVDNYLSPYVTDRNSHRSFSLAVDSLLDHSLVPRLQNSSISPLIIWGARDRLTPLKYGEKLHKQLKNSTFSVHPTAGHHLQEEEPQWLCEQIKNYLRSKS